MNGGDDDDNDDVLMGFDDFQKVAMGEDDDDENDENENNDYNKRPLSRISTRPWRENTILSSHDPQRPPSSSMTSASSHPSTHIPFHDTPPSPYFLYEDDEDEDDDDDDEDDGYDDDDDQMEEDDNDDDDDESLSFMERVGHIKTMLQCDGITIPRLSRVFGISFGHHFCPLYHRLIHIILKSF